MFQIYNLPDQIFPNCLEMGKCEDYMHEDLALQISPHAVIIAIDIFARHTWKFLTSDIPGVKLQILIRQRQNTSKPEKVLHDYYVLHKKRK